MTARTINIEVTRFVSASPDTVYALISDITKMPQFSPETTKTQWLAGTTGATVGARFRGANAIGPVRWTTKPEVTAADPGRRFAFRVPTGARSTWTYDLEPVVGGTRVTESLHTERDIPVIIKLFLRSAGVTDRPAHLREGITTTLARLDLAAIAAEAGTAATAAHV